MTLVHLDDRAYLTVTHPRRIALGPPEAPLVILNDADEHGCAWLVDVDGWQAPQVTTPMDRRPDGHGGFLGASSFDPRSLAVDGSVTAPSAEELAAAWDRLSGALLGDLSGVLRYTALDDAPAKGLWVRIDGQPRWRETDDRAADFAFTLVAEDPIKTGPAVTYGPVRLEGVTTSGGFTAPWTAPLTSVGPATLTETRRNRIPNPAPASSTGWTGSYGTGGAGTTAYSATGGPTGGPYFRRSWTTAATAANHSQYADGRAASALPIPVTPGEVLSGAIQVRGSWAGNVRAGILFYDAAGASVGSGYAAAVTLAANTWTRLTVLGVTAPAGAAYAIVGAFGPSTGTVAPVGATLDVAQAQLEVGATIGVYFDGDTPDAATLNYGWTGTVNASPSVEQTVTVGAAGAPAITVAAVGNDGNEDAHAVYRILGPVPQPVVQLSTGEYIHLALTLGPADVAAVSTADGTVQVNGVNRYDAWGPGSTFPLIPGRRRLPDGTLTPGGAEVRLRSLVTANDPAAAVYVDTAPAWR